MMSLVVMSQPLDGHIKWQIIFSPFTDVVHIVFELMIDP